MKPMCDEARGVCAAIVAAPEAWSRRAEVEGRLGAAAVLCALGVGAVEAWDRPDYAAVSLTPWGAAAMGVRLREVRRYGRQVREYRDPERPLAAPYRRAVWVAVMTPVWSGHEDDRPDRLARRDRVGLSLLRLDQVPDRRPGPEYLSDDAGEPVKVLGLPVRIDRRIR